MAATPVPYLKNLTAKEAQAHDLTAITPLSAAVQMALFTGFTQSTTATTATSGSASALPATPAGYVECVIGGNVVKIPYFNA